MTARFRVCLPAMFALHPYARLLAGATTRNLNVLLITVDDLNTDLGCYGHPYVQSPNIDRLARRGTRFEQAHVQYTLCGPSRASFLSGRYPETTRVFNNSTNPREHLGDADFLPQYFRERGYFTASLGKVYHSIDPGNVPAGRPIPHTAGPRDWDFFRLPAPTPLGRKGEERILRRKMPPPLWWYQADGTDEDQADGQIAAETIRLLEESRDRPFFIGVGFHKPHDPYAAPSRYFDMYPLDRIPPTPGPPDDAADLPDAAFAKGRYRLSPREGREFRRAYYACISFMDTQLGKLLDALQRLGMTENTLVVFFGDNGLHLGENGWWNKGTLLERSTRVPLIIAGPPAANRGKACRRTVELVDLFPTLTEAAGLPTPQGLEGKSLMPLLSNPEAAWDKPAYTVVRRGETWGRTVRTERYRYIEWDEGRLGIELYDHDNDPHEFRNLADDPLYAGTRSELRKLLRKVQRG